MPRPTKDQWGLELALITAKRATCCRRNVGCVLTNSMGHILATGYNGVAKGLPHCNEIKFVHNNVTIDINGQASAIKPEIYYPNACKAAWSLSGTNLDDCQAIHAEQNALLQCRNVYEIYTAYVTTAPCITCTKLLLNTSCQRIVFLQDYPHAEKSKSLWESAGRQWIQTAI